MKPAELLARLDRTPADELLVALSGGPDSALAAWVAVTLQPGSARALHVDHGTEAAADLAGAASAVARDLGIALEVVEIDVPAGASWEGQARQARWEALFAKVDPAEVIVTGHHQGDLAETTLGNLIRGAGSAGLAAFAQPRSQVWRPLIEIPADEVRAMAVDLDLPFIDDPSNADKTFDRNRLRHDVLPQLSTFNPRVTQALARTAHLLAADDAALETQAAAAPLREDSWGAWRVAAATVTTAPDAIAGRIIRRLLRAARPPHPGSAAEVASARDVAAGAADGAEIGGGIRLELEGPWLVAHRGPVPRPDPVDLPVPGSAVFGGFLVVAEAAPSVLVRRTSLVAAAALGETVEIRGWQPGDRIAIRDGSKSIGEVLAEAGVPARLRSTWPLVVDRGRIAAVAGIRSAPWVRGVLGEEGTIEVSVTEMQR